MSLELLRSDCDDLEDAPGKHVCKMGRLAAWVINVESLLEEPVWCPWSPDGELDRLGHPALSRSELVVEKLILG